MNLFYNRKHGEPKASLVEHVKITIAQSPRELGQQAAAYAKQVITDTLQRQARCRVVFATGTSQFELLDELCHGLDIEWQRVVAFHLDEYLAVEPTHPASFQRFLRDRVLARVPIGEFHFIDGLASDARMECQRLAALVHTAPIDVALVGMGENGHLAFNDPPADFTTTEPYIAVRLDDACRRQQVGEGWFRALEDVPQNAITMSIHQIMKARNVICSVPEERKAAAVAAALRGPVSPLTPASILQVHENVVVFLDLASASLLQSDQLGPLQRP
ncbi:MAG TPA: glucosamine-6-phosphate deaminase [Pirellulaceae bacterium]|nr:glucosamine-6-phosphate deaminase [Pirellulaceae bacterium]